MDELLRDLVGLRIEEWAMLYIAVLIGGSISAFLAFTITYRHSDNNDTANKNEQDINVITNKDKQIRNEKRSVNE